MHTKDRKNLENGQDNMPFGMGDTPIKEILQLMRDKKYSFPATIEYEYHKFYKQGRPTMDLSIVGMTCYWSMKIFLRISVMMPIPNEYERMNR